MFRIFRKPRGCLFGSHFALALSPGVRPGACAGFLNSSSDLPATGNPSHPVLVFDGAGNVKAWCPLLGFGRGVNEDCSDWLLWSTVSHHSQAPVKQS